MADDLNSLNVLGVEIWGVNVSDFGTGALILIMVTMGLTLRVSDFTRVLIMPKAALTGLFSQIILLPALAFLIVFLFQPPLAVGMGLIILSCCPSGATSNFFTHLARGDVALSVTLTAISGFIVVFTLPLLVNLGLEVFAEPGQEIHLPFLPAMLRILLLIVFPIVAGMLMRRMLHKQAEKIEPYATRVSFVAILITMAILLAHVWDHLGTIIRMALHVTLALNITMMGLGFLGAKLLKVGEARSRTITIEIGVQNYILSVVVAAGMLGRPDFVAVPILYLFIMYITVFSFIAWCRFVRDPGLARQASYGRIETSNTESETL
ncbi:MAG: hypothetical protein COB49_08625 [Alphaproteobacteria bacterium]|nr:MAG: hypothetical protein COB49_08625 [Alphaproteobacteria bacterium]